MYVCMYMYEKTIFGDPEGEIMDLRLLNIQLATN